MVKIEFLHNEVQMATTGVKNTQIYKLYQLGRTDTYSGGNYSIHNVYTLHQFITLHSIIDFKVKCIKYRVNQPLPGSAG